MSQTDAVLTVEEVAAKLRISRNLAYEMARAGRIPVIRLGRRIRVPRSALERLLDTWRPEPVRGGESDGYE